MSNIVNVMQCCYPVWVFCSIFAHIIVFFVTLCRAIYFGLECFMDAFVEKFKCRYRDVLFPSFKTYKYVKSKGK